jgi:NAD(P)-dependent dehydrogenase (short-subunit alcohol dehydrogenase family)
LDIVIANAGGANRKTLIPLGTVSKETISESFYVNSPWALSLFQVVKPLLQKSKSPIWVAITSATCSISRMEAFGTDVLSAYGIAKAALNWGTMYTYTFETLWQPFPCL